MTESALVEAKPACKSSRWCNSVSKRCFDWSLALLLLVLCSPLMLVVAAAVKLTSRGPILFRQKRPGRDGREFTIFKFRTMVVSSQQAGPVLTRAMDPRITWIGRHMRQWKLDELPQLFNVLRGEMSFVGPRPQPTKLWREPALFDDAAIVLSVRPGITSQATLVFRNEEEVLAPLSGDEVEEVYLRTLMPLKLKIEIEYLRQATFASDMRILMRTVSRVFNRRKGEEDILKEFLPSGNGVTLTAREEAWITANMSHWPVLSDAEEANTIATRASSQQGRRI